MHKGLQLLHRISILFSLSFFASYANSVLSTELKITDLPPDHGYLLLGLDIGGTAPSIEYAQVKRSKIERKRVNVPLKGKEKGFLFLSLPKGTYQITRINAPFFNLPYWLDTKNMDNWKFTIDENRVNYVGQLNIGKTRRSRTVDVRLINRIATDIKSIIAEHKDLLNLHPLKYATAIRDDFFTQYSNKTKGEIK